MECEDSDIFRGGLARVKINGRWGFIDKTGKIVIAPRFEETARFNRGIAGAMLDEKWG
jgi:hypothetical protein